jgi:hypothetical protein
MCSRLPFGKARVAKMASIAAYDRKAIVKPARHERSRATTTNTTGHQR